MKNNKNSIECVKEEFITTVKILHHDTAAWAKKQSHHVFQ